MDFSLQQNLSQKQLLGMEQRYSLEMLCKPILELREDILKKAEENPLLIVEDQDTVDAIEYRSLCKQKKDGEEITDKEEFEAEKHFNILTKGVYSQDYDPFNYVSEGQYFKDYLLEELNSTRLEKNFCNECSYIIENLNDRGYLDYPIENIAEDLSVTEFEVRQALYFVQTLHPVGVGARTLKECLLLQLMQSKYFNAHTIKLVQEGLELVAEGNIHKIAKLLDCSKEKAQEATRVVKSLNPIPSRGFKTKVCDEYIIPDAQVELENGVFRVTMNEYIVPRLTIDEHYCKIIKDHNKKDDALLHKIKDANLTIHSLGNRYETLYKIITSILEFERDYFTKSGELKPMKLSDIAERVGHNQSTVSRAVNGKYIYFKNFGTISLRGLFNKGITKENGESITAKEIKARISQFISNEDKGNPLSDEDITKALKAMGITISRRTTAKYREELGIKSSLKRKQK